MSEITSSTFLGGFPKPLISKEECLRIGGHCYKMCDYVIDTLPPIYHRVCKHCGHRQQGQRQEDYSWEDDE
jgi:hypothetical protein